MEISTPTEEFPVTYDPALDHLDREPSEEALAACLDGGLRTNDACAFLGVGRSTLYELERAGVVTRVNLGRRVIWLRSSLQRALARSLEAE